MTNLKQQLIRLGQKRPEIRDHLRPVISYIKKEAEWPAVSLY